MNRVNRIPPASMSAVVSMVDVPGVRVDSLPRRRGPCMEGCCGPARPDLRRGTEYLLTETNKFVQCRHRVPPTARRQHAPCDVVKGVWVARPETKTTALEPLASDVGPGELEVADGLGAGDAPHPDSRAPVTTAISTGNPIGRHGSESSRRAGTGLRHRHETLNRGVREGI